MLTDRQQPRRAWRACSPRGAHTTVGAPTRHEAPHQTVAPGPPAHLAGQVLAVHVRALSLLHDHSTRTAGAPPPPSRSPTRAR